MKTVFSARMLLFVLLVVIPTSSTLASDQPLFPKPLHLSRQIDDPFTGLHVVDEYCSGDRVVSVTGSRVSIADYKKGELTEIDRATNTYSITSFSELASANVSAPKSGQRGEAVAASRRVLPLRKVAGRTADSLELTITAPTVSGIRTIEAAYDRELTVSRAAAEVLIGAAFPNVRRPEHAAVLDRGVADAGKVNATAAVPIPLEQIFEYEIGGDRIRIVNRVVRMDGESPPPDLLAIPSGAQRVESAVVARQRLLRELDTLAPKSND